MMGTVLNSDAANAAGWTFSGLTLWLKSLQLTDVVQIDMLFDVIMAMGTAFFLFYKGCNALLDSKIKRQDLRRKKRENDEQEGRIGADEEM